MFLTGKCTRTLVAALALAVLLGGTELAQASPTFIKLTTGELGLGGNNINHGGNGSAVEADRPGKLVTSTANNVGSVLTIQADRKAGPGVAGNPLLVTVTARAHLDIQTGLPAGYDIHGGVITITEEKSGTPDGKDEGLGVRAFGIDTDPGSANYGKRYVNPGYSPPSLPEEDDHGFQMEGSKEVSGGTNGTDWDDFVARNDAPPDNSPPHVDEDVTFNFNNSLFNVDAKSVEVLLSKINVKDGQPDDLMLDLYIKLTSGVAIDLDSLKLSTSSIFEQVDPTYDKLWELKFSAISGLGASDFIDYFEILAIDPLISGQTRETAEHFLITGITADVPRPKSLSTRYITAFNGKRISCSFNC